MSRATIAALLLLFASSAWADGIPAPVAGISFEEWAAGNARIVKGQTLEEVRAVLGASAEDWSRADTAFLAALHDGTPGDAAFTRMGEVYEHPDAGRFRTMALPEKAPNRLKTYEDWAEVQAQLISATHAGVDPGQVLAEHGLTAADWADQARPWIEVMRKTAASPWTPARVALEARRAAVLQAYLDGYDRQYGKGRTPYP